MRCVLGIRGYIWLNPNPEVHTKGNGGKLRSGEQMMAKHGDCCFVGIVFTVSHNMIDNIYDRVNGPAVKFFG